MIIGYDFHLQGKRHKHANKEGQDYSLIYDISPAWKIAAVADGVSASSKSELASKTACESACEYIEHAFPFDSFTNSIVEEDIEAIIRGAFHAAANTIEHYADENDIDYDSLDTTLVIALFNGQSAYLGIVGDSGIGILKNDGQLLFSSPMNDEVGHVYPLRFRKAYKTASVTDVAAVFCMSDGIYKDHLIKYGEFDQRIADSYIPYQLLLGNSLEENNREIESFKKSIVEACESNENLTDDLSVALLLNTDKKVKPTERKTPDVVQRIKAELSIYEAAVQEKMFKERILKLYPFINDSTLGELFCGDISLSEAIAEQLNDECETEANEKNVSTATNDDAESVIGKMVSSPKSPEKSSVIQTALSDAKEMVQGLFSKSVDS